jgi:hypothetical protein
MATPTTTKTTNSKLTIKKSTKATGKRLFITSDCNALTSKLLPFLISELLDYPPVVI